MTPERACLLVGTDLGAFRIQDGAVQPLSSERQSVTALLPLPGGELLAGTARGRIFRSRSARREWRSVTLEGAGAPITQFVVTFTSKVHVVAVSRRGQLWRSDDLGEQFEPLVGLDGPAHLGARPDRTGSLVATAHGTIYASEDAGTTWLAQGEPSGAQCIAIHPREGDVQLLGLTAGLGRSRDGGRTIDPVESFPAGGLATGLVFRRTEEHDLAVWTDGAIGPALFTSSDAGQTVAPVDSALIDTPRDPTGTIQSATWWEGSAERHLLVATDRGELLHLALDAGRSRVIARDLPPVRALVAESAGGRFDPESSGIHILP